MSSQLLSPNAEETLTSAPLSGTLRRVFPLHPDTFMHSMILRPRRSRGATTAPTAHCTTSAHSASAGGAYRSATRRNVSANRLSTSGRSAPVHQPQLYQNSRVRVRFPVNNVHRDIHIPTDIKIGTFLN
ncbi:hypothetical protein BJ165DRAFT_1529250 [Panaeolus papilionaceus]|nr:hypothetical protein BJ165DRAFT_1529250 [Panaeolus papilionaceus]